MNPAETLVEIYGNSLQDMPLEDKLLAIIAIAKAIRIGLLDEDGEPSIADSLREEVEATSDYEVSDDTFAAIAMLDDCTTLEASDLMKRLASLADIAIKDY